MATNLYTNRFFLNALFLSAAASGFVLVDIPEASAARKPAALTRFLTRGKRLVVLGKRCDLAVQSSNFSSTRVSCTPASTTGSTLATSSRRVTLAPRQTVTVRSQALNRKKCFLSVDLESASRVEISCLAEKVTPTPTPTVVPTNTATPEPTATPTATPTANANVITDTNQLISFNTSNPAGAAAAVAVSGLTAGDDLVAIDRRPQNGLLYGLGYNGMAGTLQLYLVSSQTGVATKVGATGAFVDSVGNPVRIGVDVNTRIGMDFNPAADRVRVVTDNGQNLRINPNTGAFVDGDLGGATGSVTGVNTDGAINGATTTVDETAYTNNAPSTTITTQYTLDPVTDTLYVQNPPNSGTQTLGVALVNNLITVRGFDIASGVNAATSNTAVTAGTGFAVLEFAASSQQLFCSIDLPTGAVTASTAVANVTGNVEGLAVQGPTGVPMLGLLSGGASLVRFNSTTPGTTTTVAITGVTAGDVLVGFDFRPATGQLMALGVNAAANTGTLYVLDPQNGAATAIGTPGSIAFVDGTGAAVDLPVPATVGYGFNFNPAVDRIRVVAGSALNFRVNPNDGLPVDGNLGSGTPAGTNTDGLINGGTTSVVGASYTNSFATTPVTTLYTIDSTADALFIQNPPNNGTQTAMLAVTSNGSTLDISTVLGFEIPSETRVATSNAAVTTGIAYGAFTVGGVTGLYSINLATGVATNVGTIGTGTSALTGLAVAQTSVN